MDDAYDLLNFNPKLVVVRYVNPPLFIASFSLYILNCEEWGFIVKLLVLWRSLTTATLFLNKDLGSANEQAPIGMHDLLNLTSAQWCKEY